MESEKIENLLNLSLGLSEEERAQSEELEAGFDQITDTWELIIKYNGDITRIQASFPDAIIETLSNGYAIIIIKEAQIASLAVFPQVEYIEKPKDFYFNLLQSRVQTCVTAVKREPFSLTGEGTIVAIIDSGIDYFHPDFRNDDGTTRILDIWDQSLIAREGEAPPAGYARGVEFSSEEINQAILENNPSIVPSFDTNGHGTHVAGIAAGNGRASNGQYEGVASKSTIIVVKLGYPKQQNVTRTPELMLAIDYVVKKAISYGKPVSVNISIGNTYGSHSGDSLLETYIDSMSQYGRTVIAIGSGNEGAGRGHTSGQLSMPKKQRIQWAVDEYEPNLSLQIWKNYVDEIEVVLYSPAGTIVGPVQRVSETVRYQVENTEIFIYYGRPSPYSIYQEIYISFLPKDDYIEAGLWEIELIPKYIVSGDYNMWLPVQSAVNQGTGFLKPTVETTLTIPSTTSKVITVGAYDGRMRQLADFSGRGYTRATKQVKPDVVAPGVDITSCAVGGGYIVASGTSMATPFVTGGAALLMEWGIVRGNDPYLYGEKMKAYIQEGARPLEVMKEYPNPAVGWGTLCVRDSLPV